VPLTPWHLDSNQRWHLPILRNLKKKGEPAYCKLPITIIYNQIMKLSMIYPNKHKQFLLSHLTNG